MADIVTKVDYPVTVGGKTNMGFKQHLDYTRIHHDIYIAGVELNNNRNDGFTQWCIKQNLYRLNWLIEDILQKSPKFSLEDEFLLEHDKAKVLDALKP